MFVSIESENIRILCDANHSIEHIKTIEIRTNNLNLGHVERKCESSNRMDIHFANVYVPDTNDIRTIKLQRIVQNNIYYTQFYTTQSTYSQRA